ncbi:MAG: dihydrofolate reductase [Omnitrophica WOR_2 bacterium]
MIISLLVAMDQARGIGINNRLPWHLSADLKRFKRLTMGHHMVMGRKTYESIGRPLPGRITIILTHDQNYQADGCLVSNSLEDALALAKARGEQEVFIIGGGEIFSQVLDRADRLYLTYVHARVEADVFFPLLNEQEWLEIDSADQPADENNQYSSTYRCLIRKPLSILDKSEL